MLGYTKDRGDRLGHERRISEWRELRQPYSIRIALQQLRCHLQGEAGLATAPGTGEGEEVGVGEQVLDLGDLPFPPDETGDLSR